MERGSKREDEKLSTEAGQLHSRYGNSTQNSGKWPFHPSANPLVRPAATERPEGIDLE
jgi:hypothetical protein